MSDEEHDGSSTPAPPDADDQRAAMHTMLREVGFDAEEADAIIDQGFGAARVAYLMIHRLAIRVNLMEEYLRRKAATASDRRIITPGEIN